MLLCDDDENASRSCFNFYLCCCSHHSYVICISKLSIRFSKLHTACVLENFGVFGFHILPPRLFSGLDIYGVGLNQWFTIGMILSPTPRGHLSRSRDILGTTSLFPACYWGNRSNKGEMDAHTGKSGDGGKMPFSHTWNLDH